MDCAAYAEVAMIGSGPSNGDALTEDRPTERPSPTIRIPEGRWGRARHQLNLVSQFQDYKRKTGSKSRTETVDRLLRLGVMFGLLIAAGAAFISASATLAGQTLSPWFAAIVPAWLNASLLIFIILELAHTVREQIEEARLSRKLVCDLLAIGVLSSVRHLLAVGAWLQARTNLSTGDLEPALKMNAIIELAVSAVIVLLLVVGWRLAGGSSEREAPVEP
jgi:hypothetical protein